tara:strand:- start:381 stop:1151 length:771 start_codon:yes stop_codon:yes gene_type:complete
LKEEIAIKLAKLYLRDISLNSSLVLTDHFKRLSFELSILNFNKEENISYIDVGGGDGLLAGLINYSYPKIKCFVVDDFKDQNSYENELMEYLKKRGVHFIKADAARDSSFIYKIGADKNISIISCLNSIEHWHISPRDFLLNAYQGIMKGGELILAFPNNSNIKKRLLAIFGNTTWSNFDYWFDNNEFRGHVREPNVSDLKLISKRLGCNDVEIYGRNFIGIFHPNKLVRFISKILDHFLRFFPSFCSDIYIVMKK